MYANKINDQCADYLLSLVCHFRSLCEICFIISDKQKFLLIVFTFTEMQIEEKSHLQFLV